MLVTERDQFVRWDRSSPLLDHLGDLQSHSTKREEFGFVVDEPKLNGRGFLHAGAICTIADVCIGHTLAASTEPPTPLVTLNLNTTFLGTARAGEWIDVTVEAQRVGRRVAAGRATFRSDERVVAEVTGLFMPRSDHADRAAISMPDSA